MSPRKLSDSDRQEILKLYRQTAETTSSLAARFGVSSSTISRFLKTNLSGTEYEDLIQEKRLARTAKEEEEPQPQPKKSTSNPKTKSRRARKKKIESQVSSPEEENTTQLEITIDVPAKSSEPDNENQKPQSSSELINSNQSELDDEEDDDDLESVKEVAAMFGEDMDEEDDDEEDDDDDDDDDEGASDVSLAEELQVLPLKNAHFPRTCYLVIDRHAELVTKPMKDFAHLGTIPDSEVQQKTLPIFDNHKVAKRFCDRKGKVIKVPDGRVLQKTSTYLQAKGISRVLMDGKVYSLVNCE